MKIGIDARNLEGRRTGVGRYLFNLLEQWSFFDLPNDLKFILYFKNQIPEDIPRGGNFQSKLLKGKSNALFIHCLLSRAAKRDKIDILFCPAYIAPVFYRGNIALTLHDIIYEARPDLYNWPSIFDRILLKRISKISAKKAKIIFTCSQFSKNEILKHYPSTKLGANRIHVISLAADAKFKKIECATPKKKFIFYIGAIIKRRFVPETVKAFNKIANKLPGYKFLIVGKNYTNQQIRGNRIIHKDHVDENDLALLYNAADLFIWLSSYEGFGLPPLEAMACGTPVVTTELGSLPETVGNAALFVKNPEDVEEISQTIYKGLTDKNLREKLIKTGLEQAKKFSWQKTAKETLEVLLDHEKR